MGVNSFADSGPSVQTVGDSDLKEAVEKLDRYLKDQGNTPIMASKGLPS